ncbi:MAG: hypothetical protein EB039_08525, partial [Proteobacteria bacterium]|nr:hypothetical protein [Pseudomonadota bacterium]
MNGFPTEDSTGTSVRPEGSAPSARDLLALSLGTTVDNAGPGAEEASQSFRPRRLSPPTGERWHGT